MPKTQISYENTYFYKIVCKDLSITDLYVGHTTNFRIRKNGHKTNCNNSESNSHNIKVYQFIRENGGWDNFDMILIEQCSCLNKLDAERRERKYIEELSATLNQCVPSRSKKEWTQDNKEKIKDYKHQYHLDHIEEIHETKRNKYQEKKEEIIAKVKENYEKNKEKYHEWKNAKFDCNCGGCYTNSTKARHLKTEKHQNYLKSLEED